MMAMARRRRLRFVLGPERGRCDGAEVSNGQPSSSMAEISLTMYRERMRSIAWLHQPSGRSGAQRFMEQWCNRWWSVSVSASLQKRQAPGVAADPGVEVDSGKRPPRMSQCGDHTYNATAVTFHFGPRFRASVSGLGFALHMGGHPKYPMVVLPELHNCTQLHNIRIRSFMFKLLFTANATRSRGTFGRNMVEYQMVRGVKPRRENLE